MMGFPGNKLMWRHWDITVLVWWRNVPFTNTPPWYWCIFWLPSSVTCKMCTMLWPVFFWPLPDWSGEPYFMLVTPDRGSCSSFPCRQSSHWYPDGHVQVRAAGSVPNIVKIDSYLVVFIKRRGRGTLYNRRVLGVGRALVYLKPPVIAAFPDWNWLCSRAGKLGSCHCWREMLFSLLADNKPHSRHAKELEDKQAKQRNSKWGLVLGSLVFAFACEGEADTAEDAAALCQCSQC